MRMIVKLSPIILIGLVFLSCGKSSLKPPTGLHYTVNGVVVKDMTTSKDLAFFSVLRDSVPYSQALVKVDTVKIDSLGGGVFFKEFLINKFKPKYSYSITIFCPQDSTTITFPFVMPDTFRIASINPPYGDFQMRARGVEWRASFASTGYFISVREKAPAQGAKGFLGYPDIGTTSVTIPIESFYNGTVPIFNTYYINIVAYYKSFLTFPNIPFSLPGGLPLNNINGASGTIGIGVLAPVDSIKISSL
jgi:hypothetical protein